MLIYLNKTDIVGMALRLAEMGWSLDFAAGRYVSPEDKTYFRVDDAYLSTSP